MHTVRQNHNNVMLLQLLCFGPHWPIIRKYAVQAVVSCNSAFPDDGPVSRKTWQSWHIITLLWMWRIV